jgi:hypothetical protein
MSPTAANCTVISIWQSVEPLRSWQPAMDMMPLLGS